MGALNTDKRTKTIVVRNRIKLSDNVNLIEPNVLYAFLKCFKEVNWLESVNELAMDESVMKLFLKV